MSGRGILRLGTLKDVARFQAHVQALGLNIPCDAEVVCGPESPLRKPLVRGEIEIGNRIAVHPMEGWDGTADGNPGEHTIRRWKRFGQSGGKLIWGGEAVAVSHGGRANPNQLVAAQHTRNGLAKLREVLIEEHRRTTGSDEGLLIGLQLTHSGRFCRPNAHNKPEPRILYHHPILDRRLGLIRDYPILTDGEIEAIVEDFHRAAKMARNWASILWTSNIATATWDTSFSARIREKGSTAEVSRIARVFCAKWCKGSARRHRNAHRGAIFCV